MQKDIIYHHSMNNFMRYNYNRKFADTMYSKLSKNPDLDVIQAIGLNAPMWGNLAA
jgi:hypothetical protein